jgi:transposase-like protein
MPVKTNISMIQVREMHELYQQGAMMKDVGKRFGISESRVSALFKGAGLQSRAPRPPAGGYPVGEMYETYQGGAAMDEVARQFGVSKPTISKLFKAAGLKARPTNFPAADYPVQEMYALYQRGATFDEVGQRFGLTRESIRQIFNRAGLKTRTPNEVRRLMRQNARDRAEEIVRERGEEIVESFLRLKDLRLVASELEIAQQTVRSVLNERLSRSQYRAITQKPAKRTYTDEQLIAFLREASADHSKPLSIKSYEKFVDNQQAVDGQRCPTHQTHQNRFGSWRNALLKAGLPANPTTPVASMRVFEAPQCIDAIRAAHQALGKIPTAAEYEQYARASKGASPSPATVSKRCGTWTDAIRMAGL